MIPLGVLASADVAPAGGTFSPADIAGLDLWLEGDSLTGLTSGDPIDSWADSSSAGNTATQSNSANRPTYSTAKGYPSAWFGGTLNHYLTTAASSSGASQTIFAVITVEDDLIRTPVGSSATTSFVLEFTSFRRLNARSWGGIGNAIMPASDAPDVGTITAIGGAYDSPSNQMRVWRGTISPYTSTTVAHTAGRTVRIGIKATTAERHHGHVFEVLHYSANLGETDRAAVQSYLMSKYGISV